MTILFWTAPQGSTLRKGDTLQKGSIIRKGSVVPAKLVTLTCAVLSCMVLTCVALTSMALTSTTASAAQPSAHSKRNADTSMTQRPSDASPDTVFFANGIRWGRSLEAQLRTRRLMKKVASTGESEAADAEAGVSIGGLVINDTRTTIGRDFYDAFYSRWSTPEGTENVIIRVREQPRPNLGTRILVEVEDERVFQATLQPRLQQIQKAARVARARAQRYLKRRYEPRTRY